MTQCTARAFVFSGRPDPAWFIGGRHEHDLVVLWDQLKATVAHTYTESRLGYRGVSMTCPDKEFIAYGGYVRRKVGKAIEWRIDERRHFELLLLSTAPKDLLPVGVVDT